MTLSLVFFRRLVWALRDFNIELPHVIEMLSQHADARTIRGWWSAPHRPWRDDEASAPKKAPGRHRLLTDDQAEELGQQLKANKTLRMLAASNNVSKGTIHNAVHRLGFESYRPHKVPALTEVHAGNRLKYAKKYLRQPKSLWKRVMWTDESAFTLQRRSERGRWKHKDDPRKVQLTGNNKGKVMVWGGISSKGTTPLLFLEWEGTGMNAADYQKQVIRPVARLLSQEPFKDMMFMQDYAPIKNARTTSQLIARRGIKKFPEGDMSWPANSPDLNPVENVWAWMKQRLAAMDTYPTSVESMKAKLTELWNEITPGFCQRFTDGYQERLEKVVEAQGYTTKY